MEFQAIREEERICPVAEQFGQIDINNPFIMFCKCSVLYEGRAYSILEAGNYLIVFKSDKSIQIHGNNKIHPRNYQGSNTQISYQDKCLICINKKEKISIQIENISFARNIDGWSSHEIKISRTESELVDKISNNINKYINNTQESYTVEREYKTENGPIDLFAHTDSIGHLIEVKRRKATVTDGTQLNKYHEAIKSTCDYNILKCYLAAPSIGKNAKRYLDEKGYLFIEVSWDD